MQCFNCKAEVPDDAFNAALARASTREPARHGLCGAAYYPDGRGGFTTFPPTDPNFDAAGAKRDRDRALEAVDSAADEQFKAGLDAAIDRVARRQLEFTSDDVWQEAASAGVQMPAEKRALGPRMLRAARAGIIEKSERHRLTERRSRHAAPIAIWESRIYRSTPGS